MGGSGAADPAAFEGFNYTALGHLHRPQCIAPANGAPPQTNDSRAAEFPAGDLFAADFPSSDSQTNNSPSGDSPGGAMTAPIQYSGSLLKYSFAEAGRKKSVTCVELDAAGSIRAERRAIAPRRDVRRVEGKLLEILAAAERDARREDYIMASLLDDGPILDAMGRLREAYPNCLHLERPALQAAAETGAWAGAGGGPGGQRRMADLELFERFFEQMTGGAISGEQRKALTETIAEARRAEREANA